MEDAKIKKNEIQHLSTSKRIMLERPASISDFHTGRKRNFRRKKRNSCGYMNFIKRSVKKSGNKPGRFRIIASKKLLSFQTSLLDLPIPITELILERLPLPDYIRFGSICTKCHSIQKQHRKHHAPLPPPMRKSFPWLIARFPKDIKIKLLRCYSPLEKKSFPLTIAEGYSIIFFASASSHGWFFMVNEYRREHVSLFNPVTKSQIKFPSLLTDLSVNVKGFLSSSPLNPDCVALILDANVVSFIQLGRGQLNWTQLYISCNWDLDTDCVYCNEKIYCIGRDLCVIDLVSATVTNNELYMDCSQLPPWKYCYNRTLVESNGEVLLVVLLYNKQCTRIESFDVFKADFSRMVWVRLRSIGDHALFVATDGSFSVLAEDVGCKSNCVYFMKNVKTRYDKWSVFDMDTMKWLDGPPLPYKEAEQMCYIEQWYIPSLDYNV